MNYGVNGGNKTAFAAATEGRTGGTRSCFFPLLLRQTNFSFLRPLNNSSDDSFLFQWTIKIARSIWLGSFYGATTKSSSAFLHKLARASAYLMTTTRLHHSSGFYRCYRYQDVIYYIVPKADSERQQLLREGICSLPPYRSLLIVIKCNSSANELTISRAALKLASPTSAESLVNNQRSRTSACPSAVLQVCLPLVCKQLRTLLPTAAAGCPQF